MKIKNLISISMLVIPSLLFSSVTHAKVNITPSIESIVVTHDGKEVTIERSQDSNHKIGDGYDKTSRQCPPFCIQPSAITEDVQTIAEVEVLAYLKGASEGEPVMVVDARKKSWLARGTIPGSVNIPWTKINKSTQQAWSEDMVEETADDVLIKYFGVTKEGDKLNFDKAKTLAVFCNGPWCGQSGNFIRTLLHKGYPAENLKWYRGGMQAWESFGLTTVKPE